MSWLRRFFRSDAGGESRLRDEARKEAKEEVQKGEPRQEEPRRVPGEVERSAPGIHALFQRLVEGGDHTLLDLGAPSPPNLERYSRFAKRIRFADLLAGSPEAWDWDALLPSVPQHLYDVVVGWDILDRVPPRERHPLMERIRETTAPGAHMYMAVRASDAEETRPWRYVIRAPDRVVQEPEGAPEKAHAQILPAEVERLLKPFQVLHAYTVRVNVREYVAVKAEEASA